MRTWTLKKNQEMTPKLGLFPIIQHLIPAQFRFSLGTCMYLCRCDMCIPLRSCVCPEEVTGFPWGVYYKGADTPSASAL